MLITYFDEVKPSYSDQPYYWLGGLMVDHKTISTLEQEVNALAVECFGDNSGLTKQTEFHATDIAIGKHNFNKVKDPKIRFDILKKLIKIYDKQQGIFRVTVRLNTAKLYDGTDVERMAMMYLIERVNNFCTKKKTSTILIGDYEKEKTVNKAVQSLAKYKKDGTPYAFGQDIKNIIDTVHFAHSYNSRLLQLADTYMWTQQLRHRVGEQSDLRKDLTRFIREDTDTSRAHTYKYWPRSGNDL